MYKSPQTYKSFSVALRNLRVGNRSRLAPVPSFKTKMPALGSLRAGFCRDTLVRPNENGALFGLGAAPDDQMGSGYFNGSYTLPK
jgi:hypothetical protein